MFCHYLTGMDTADSVTFKVMSNISVPQLLLSMMKSLVSKAILRRSPASFIAKYLQPDVATTPVQTVTEACLFPLLNVSTVLLASILTMQIFICLH